MDVLKSLSENTSAFLGSIGVYLLAALVILGLAHKAGRAWGFTKEKERRKSQGQPNIELLSGTEKPELPWKDSSLLLSGLKASSTVGINLLILCLGVFLLSCAKLLFLRKLLTVDEVLNLISPVMYILIILWVLIAANMSYKINRTYKLPILSLWKPFLFSLISVVLVYYLSKQPLTQVVMVVESLLLAVVSVNNLNQIGVVDGIEDANIEKRFPLVAVRTTQGKMKKLWLYEKTDSDYRFIGNDGITHVFPNWQIAEITYPVEEMDEPNRS